MGFVGIRPNPFQSGKGVFELVIKVVYQSSDFLALIIQDSIPPFEKEIPSACS
jgi:hypothetical protein